jgi:hypothetical protein
LVRIETAKATALVGVAVASATDGGDEWVNPDSLMTKKPRARANVIPKAANPRRGRLRREYDEYKLSLR